MSEAITRTRSLVALVLVPIGIVVFREKLSIVNVIGVVLSLAGLMLLRR
jgi:multidrug transporter EmrE-like cation transporter